MAVYNRSKKIKIFYLENGRDVEGNSIKVKKYIHPIESYINAHYRDLRSSETNNNDQALDFATVQFTIIRRAIVKDMFIEYDRKDFGLQTYTIISVDGYDDLTNDMKLNADLVKNEIEFDEVEGTEWKKS